ncbi:Transcription initiation factor TFIID subunit 111 KDa [Spraguea lophii 42_110]|uniref:Transcription initiation factor TFIID subunit 111 kDa n=1 Tax=Spraguea lophii (strain 42_110) TaxID=1358809 RepID=S7W5Z7_SPRLO|nr:Transcription initiation factor TFIID subunit 111 KDa [Spraguea lophii 42_110]
MPMRINANENCADEKKKINFLDILVPYKPYEYKLKKYKIRNPTSDKISYEVDDQIKFRQNLYEEQEERKNTFGKNLMVKRNIYQKKFEKEVKQKLGGDKDTKKYINIEKEVLRPIDYIEWEKDIIYDETEEKNMSEHTKILNYQEKVRKKEIVNDIFEKQWESQIFYDEQDVGNILTHVIIQDNDPNLVLEKIEHKKRTKSKKKYKESLNLENPFKSKYNLSNDKYYSDRAPTEQNFGVLGLQHTLPALKLYPKLYRTCFTNDELRNMHRPVIKIKKGTIIRFEEHASSKFTTSSVIKKATELSLNDFSDFLLFEYSEEYPLVLSNPGMISLFTTYYRKSSSGDEPGVVEDNMKILDVDEVSPFMNFGDVNPGCILSEISNNLYKAPIFMHKTDRFLLILQKNENKEYVGYIRPFKNIYVVGQIFPLQEIFGPHSRKYNIFCKNRLKVTAFKIFQRKENKEKTLKAHQLNDLFPQFSEGSKRKCLREYAEPIRKGKENVWTLKHNITSLLEEELRKLITPEDTCLYESMLSGERLLKDCGHVFREGEENEEIVLSPWVLSRNFVSAYNGRGLLELSGAGDPTGIGQGFSFVKLSQKKGDTERKYTNEALNKYKGQIQKIWNAQNEFLSSTPTIEYDENKDTVIEEVKSIKEEKKEKSESNKYLLIKRTISINGIEEEEEEKIYDKEIIDLYLKRRKKIKTEDKKPGLKCGSCGQIGHMKTNKSCPNFIMSSKKKILIKKSPKAVLGEIIAQIISSFFSLPYSVAFHRPVSAKKFPDYHTYIKSPMDLGTMRTKAKNAKYNNYSEFIEDTKLMTANCKVYNGTEHSLTKLAFEIEEKAINFYERKKEEMEEIEKEIEAKNNKTENKDEVKLP